MQPILDSSRYLASGTAFTGIITVVLPIVLIVGLILSALMWAGKLRLQRDGKQQAALLAQKQAWQMTGTCLLLLLLLAGLQPSARKASRDMQAVREELSLMDTLPEQSLTVTADQQKYQISAIGKNAVCVWTALTWPENGIELRGSTQTLRPATDWTFTPTQPPQGRQWRVSGCDGLDDQYASVRIKALGEEK